MDDIIFTFLIKRLRIMEAIMVKLKKRYNLIGGKDLQWFLGIEIIQDRYKGYTALIQKVYLKQLRKNYGINTNPITPII